MSGPSGGIDNSSSSQNVWAPYAGALTPMLEQAGGMFNKSMNALNDPSLQSNLNAWNNDVQGSAMDIWKQQAGGGNLAGYDIAGGLEGMMGQDNNISAMNSAQGVLDNNLGPGGSLANMEGMYRRQANDARADMLGSMDARAAASGMSGGSRHGTAIGRGMEGINNNLQDQMANTGYDAYNRDLDRKLGVAGTNDAANLQAQSANQGFAGMQQQMMQQMLGAQNASQAGALGQTGAMAGLGGLDYQAALAPFMGYSQMLQGMGPATVLTESEGKSMNFGT